MKNLALRIYCTVVAVLLLFAFASGWVFQRQMEHERRQAATVLADRMAAWGDLIQRSLPGADALHADQVAALREWSMRLRIPLALDSPQGERIGASDSFLRRQSEHTSRVFPVRLEDGRTLWILRPGMLQPPPGAPGNGLFPFMPPGWQRGAGLVAALLVLFVAVAAGAWPVVRRLTHRLQALKQGMEIFGTGQLGHRVEVSGRDEVAAVAASFNQAATRIETLVRAHQSLLANASHELRSPLARMKVAMELFEDAPPSQREPLKQEIRANIAELDALVEEVLLASQLDALRDLQQRDKVDLLGLAAEEAARVNATLDGTPLTLVGDERLLRRALRNLLENAKRYGGNDISVSTRCTDSTANVRVCDRGPGVPEDLRERIFEPFYRLPGHAEKAGGVGLGLSLVKQIAQRHGGDVRCEAHDGGGSCFVITLPMSSPHKE